MSVKRILEVVGVQTVHICTLTDDAKHVTRMAVTIMALGTVLLLMVDFKGMPLGCIAKNEFGAYPTTH